MGEGKVVAAEVFAGAEMRPILQHSDLKLGVVRGVWGRVQLWRFLEHGLEKELVFFVAVGWILRFVLLYRHLEIIEIEQ